METLNELSEENASPGNDDVSLKENTVDIAKRFIAALIDGVVVAAISVIPVIGGLAGTAYFLVRDGLDLDFMKGRSLGKVFMKLRPVRADRKPMDIQTSIQRNWMFALGALAGVLVWIPLIGWLLIPVAIFLALGVGLFEIYNVVSNPDGRRWGDKLAGTTVVESDD